MLWVSRRNPTISLTAMATPFKENLMTKKVEFFFDITSPYSYLATTQFDALLQRCPTELRWRPFLLGGVFKATNNHAPVEVPAKFEFMKKDLTRWARFYGKPLSMPSRFPLLALLSMRALTSLSYEEMVPAAQRLFTAYWVEDLDVADPEVVGQLIGAPAVEQASNPQIKEILKQTTAEAVERGAFGAPTFFVDDQMFFGNDRLQFLEEYLQS